MQRFYCICVKVIKLFIGLFLAPLCAAFSLTLWDLINAIRPESASLIPLPAAAMLIGLGLWLILYFIIPRPVRTYILAHELTHALWGALMGASIFSIKVNKDRGAVTLSKNNFLITLAPYFFPFYTVLTVAAYYLLSVFIEVERYELFWLGAIGLTWGFHLTFTISALMQHQTDIHEHGRLFSYAVIYLFNVLGACLWIIMISPVTIETFIALLSNHSIEAWQFTSRISRQTWIWLQTQL